MFDGQMEMSFGSNGRASRAHRQSRRTRAQWWFRRMRQIVDLATDWQPVPAPRPVQIWFPAAENRGSAVPVMGSASGFAEQHQICE